MINLGYAISVKDAEDMRKFKESAAYGTYLKSISGSPAFQLIMKEHINNVDVTEDIKSLKNQGKIPDGANPKTISDLFKQSLSKMAICLVADSIILKELEDVRMEEIVGTLSSEADTNYLLGKADKKYYEQAAKLVEEGKLEESSLGYRGLINYMRTSKDQISDLKKAAVKPPAVQKVTATTEKKTKASSSCDEEVLL